MQTATLTPIVVNTLDIVFPSPMPTPILSPTRPPTSTPITSTPTFEPINTITPAPTYIYFPTIDPPVRNPEIKFPSNLILDEWVLAENSSLRIDSFTPTLGTREQILQKYQYWQDIFDNFPSPLIRGYYNKVVFDGRELIVKEEITSLKSTIHVFYDGEEITQVDAGYNFPPTTNIWGFWTYENHWIMEYVTVFHNPYGNSYKLGNIIYDGESLNAKFNYQESFGLTAINGRIFYFFRRNNRFGVSFDWKEYNLDYESVLHYIRPCGECEDYQNPQKLGFGYQADQNLSFFAERNGNKYFVVIWAK